MDTSLKHHIIELENCGNVSVYIQGDEDKLGNGVTFMTVHDVGTTYQTWLDFTSHPCMADALNRSAFLHVVIPGQGPDEEELPKDFVFPTITELGIGLVTILDQLRVSRVVAMGDGAGANIITRFAMMHPQRVHGIITVNNTATPSHTWFMETLKDKINAVKQKHSESSVNEKNVTKFAEAYKKRTEILTELNNRIKVDVLLIAGMKSKYSEDTEAIHREMTPGICSMIKVEEVVEPLDETPGKVAEAILLFCQGMGLLPNVQAAMARRISRQEHNSESSDDGQRQRRKTSLTNSN